MFNLFKKTKKAASEETKANFEIELTASVLAYEVARSDGNIPKDELQLLLDEINKISENVGKTQ